MCSTISRSLVFQDAQVRGASTALVLEPPVDISIVEKVPILRLRHSWGGIAISTGFSTVFFIRFSAMVFRGFLGGSKESQLCYKERKRVLIFSGPTGNYWWGRWNLNPRPPGFSRFRSRAGYHTMLDNGPKRRNRARVPNSIFLLIHGTSVTSASDRADHFCALKISQFLSLVLMRW
jgi:hypothetical protein